MPRPAGSLVERAVLLGPDRVARAAAARARRPEERWMLRQPRAVRRSYVHDVLGGGDPTRAEAAWLLRQPEPVRESYVREVLEGA